jgi:hypothetical protein
MRIVRVTDAGRQPGIAPEKNEVEHGLHGKQQVEQDQRAQDLRRAQEFTVGLLGRRGVVEGGRRHRGEWLRFPAPPADMDEGPHQRERRSQNSVRQMSIFEAALLGWSRLIHWSISGFAEANRMTKMVPNTAGTNHSAMPRVSDWTLSVLMTSPTSRNGPIR